MPDGTTLTKHWGTLVITEPGTVIDSVEVFGMVRVEAPDVTIRRSILRGDPTLGSVAVYSNHKDTTNLLLEDVEIAPLLSTPRSGGVYGHDFTIRRANIHGVIDQVHVFGGGNVTVEDSFLHSNAHFAYDPIHRDGTHDDNVQIQEGSEILIRNNVLSGAWNAAIQITQGLGPSAGIEIADNWIEGGGCSLNVDEGKHGAINRMTITNNIFGGSRFGCAILLPRETKSGAAIDGNITEAGKDAQLICRGSAGNRPC